MRHKAKCFEVKTNSRCILLRKSFFWTFTMKKQARITTPWSSWLCKRSTRPLIETNKPIHTFIFNHKPVKLWFHVKVGEQQVNAAAWFRDDQPDAVQVVSVLLRVVWREYGPRRGREVKETRDCREEKVIGGEGGCGLGQKTYSAGRTSASASGRDSKARPDEFRRTDQHRRDLQPRATHTRSWVCCPTTGCCAGTWWSSRPPAQRPTGRRRSACRRAESAHRYGGQTPAPQDHRSLLAQSL